MANRKRTFSTRSSYAVLARMDELSDDSSFSDLYYSSEEELYEDEDQSCIFDLPGKFITEQNSMLTTLHAFQMIF